MDDELKVNPDIKKLFPDKTDFQIAYGTYNPCEHCEIYGDDFHCDDYCVLGRFWKREKENNAE